MVRRSTGVAADNAVVVARLFAALENPYLHDIALRSERDNSGEFVPSILLASSGLARRRTLTEPFAEGGRDAFVRGGNRSGVVHDAYASHSPVSSFACDKLLL